MNQTRLNVRIEGVMADHVDGLIEKKLYNSQSEYVRDLIRHDMDKEDGYADFLADTRRSLKEMGAGNYEEWDGQKSLQEAKAYSAARNKK